MKRLIALFSTAVLLALAIGCSTTSTKDKEAMLSAAGFKMMPADTPEKQAHLKSLPANEITTVEREGTLYYVFPDQKNNVAYVGQQQQYQAYQNLHMQKQMADEQLNTAQMYNSDPWGVWGPWHGPVGR
jgi:hypothetical protein